MYQVIDGKKISQEIKDELKEKAAAMAKEGKKVALAVIQVGNDPASSVYVRNKKKACEYTASNHFPMNCRKRQLRKNWWR